MDATYDSLVQGGVEARVRLMTSLRELSTRRVFGKALTEEECEGVVKATVERFFANLPASEAVAAADYRAGVRLQEHDELESTRASETQAQLAAGFDQLSQKLDAQGTFSDRIALLPSSVRQALETAGSRTAAIRLIDIVSTGDPAAGLIAIALDVPAWLAESDGSTLVGAAELARLYGAHRAAGVLFELATDSHPDRGYMAARAAAEFWEAGAKERATALLDRAATFGDDKRVSAVRCALGNDGAGILTTMSVEEALADPFLTAIFLYGLKRERPVDDVIQFLDQATERHPDSAGFLIHLALARLERSQVATASSRTRDRLESLNTALRARDLRRRWRGNSTEPARVACQSALLLGDFARVLSLGRVAPDGDALPTEAADADIRLAVAEAAIVSGQRAVAESLVEDTPTDFRVALLRAEVYGVGAQSSEAAEEAYRLVWSLAQEDHEKALYWLSAASAGVQELAGADELAGQSDEFRALVRGQQMLARNQPTEAVAILRPHRRSEPAARLLVAGLLAMEDIDGAITELRDAYSRFNDSAHLVRAVEVLIEHRRLDAAAAIAEDALQRVPHSLEGDRALLHEVLVEQCGQEKNWNEMALRAQAWIDDLGPSQRARWSLVFARFHGGDEQGAWEAASEAPVLDPLGVHESKIWMRLSARFIPGATTCERYLEFVDRFPDDPTVAQVAVAAFFLMGDENRGDLQEDVVKRFQDLMTAHSVDFDDRDDAPLFRLHGSAEEMLDQLRPILQAQALALSEATERVRNGYPYGSLTLVSNRPYSAALIHRAAGCLPIASRDPSWIDRERRVARAALERDTAIDISSVVIGWYLASDWPTLTNAFARVHVSGPARQDVLAAVAQFAERADGTMYFDPSVGDVRVEEANLDVQERLRQQGEWVRQQLDGFVTHDWSSLRHTFQGAEIPSEDRILPWATAIDMAAGRRWPLWCDDLGLRVLAEEAGVESFGTVSLLDVLFEAGRISQAVHRTALRTLREEYAVDLPPDDEWLRLSAASAEWKSGPALLHFARPPSWIGSVETWNLWASIAQSAAECDSCLLPRWVRAAAEGLVRAVPQDPEGILVALGARAITMSGFEARVLADCLALLRELAKVRGIQNPVPQLLALLLGELGRTVGAQQAGRILLRDELDDADRAVLLDLLFGR